MGATEDTGGPHEYILLVAALGDAMRLPSRFHLIVWEAKLLGASADIVDRPTGDRKSSATVWMMKTMARNRQGDRPCPPGQIWSFRHASGSRQDAGAPDKRPLVSYPGPPGAAVEGDAQGLLRRAEGMGSGRACADGSVSG